MKIALQLYSVRDESEKNFEGTLKAVSDFGYDGVEFAGLYGRTPKDVRTLCEGYGLIPVSAHVGIPEMTENDRTFSDYKKIGCEYIAVPYVAPDNLSDSEKRNEMVSTVKKLSEKAKFAGLKMLYHNHAHELLKLGGKSFLDELYTELSPELLNPEFDVCWLHFAGEDPAEYLKRYSGRINVIHLKDYIVPAGAERPAFRPVGKGIMDIPAVIEAANRGGAEWLIVEQDDPTNGERTLDEARRSIEYLRSI